jgi:hypothetical protein
VGDVLLGTFAITSPSFQATSRSKRCKRETNLDVQVSECVNSSEKGVRRNTVPYVTVKCLPAQVKREASGEVSDWPHPSTLHPHTHITTKQQTICSASFFDADKATVPTASSSLSAFTLIGN